MENSSIKVKCPYCNARFSTAAPLGLEQPGDVEFMPYTRDTGRFDPVTPEEWLSPKGWTRIGKDYLKWINWEHIGILRITHPDLHIQYRVQGCPECKSLFDIYANYSDLPLKDIWPHIFGSDPDDSETIKPYSGNSWITWLIRHLGRIVKPNSLSAILIGIVILGASFLPWIFAVQPDQELQLSSFFRLTLLIRTIGVIGIIASLILIDHYVRFFEEIPGFNKLLDIRQQRGLIHWRNYTLCRLVGVQDSKGVPHLTQIDVFVGGLTLLTVMPIWMIVKVGWIGLLYWLSGLVVVFLLDFSLFKLTRKFEQLHWLKYSRLIILLLLLSSAYAWGLVKWGKAQPFMRWDNINAIFDLIFWIIVIYILGSAAWIAISSTVYILKGLSTIPMDLSPYTGFLNSRPLRRMQGFSSSLLMTFFGCLVAILSILIVFEQSMDKIIFKQWLSGPNWIINFMFLVVGAIIVSLGLSTRRITFVYITLIYAAVTLLTSGASLTIGTFELNGQLITLGIFFSSIMIYQLFATDDIIRKILMRKKENVLNELSEEIKKTHKEFLSPNSSMINNSQDIHQAQVQEKRRIALESLEKLTNIIKTVEKTPIHENLKKRIFESMSPLLTAIVVQQFTNILLGFS